MLTGTYTESMTRKKKNLHAQALSRLAQKARNLKLSPERRRAIAQKAAQARWAKWKKEHGDTKPYTKFPTGRREA
jgi:hypothetical protein